MQLIYCIKPLNWNANQIIEPLKIILIFDFCWWYGRVWASPPLHLSSSRADASDASEAAAVAIKLQALYLRPRHKHKTTANMQLMSILYNCSKNRIRTLYRSTAYCHYPSLLSRDHLSGCQVNDMDTPLEPRANESERARVGVPAETMP